MALNSLKYNKEAFFCVEKNIIDDFYVLDLLKKIDCKEYIALDMSNVEEIRSFVFIEALQKNKFRLINVQTEVLTYLSLVLKNGFLKTYINKEDLLNNKRELLRRRFLID